MEARSDHPAAWWRSVICWIAERLRLPVVLSGNVEGDFRVHHWRLRWVPRDEQRQRADTSHRWRKAVEAGRFVWIDGEWVNTDGDPYI